MRWEDVRIENIGAACGATARRFIFEVKGHWAMLMKRKMMLGVAAVLMMACGAGGFGAGPAVLEKVPADASAVVVVRNVKDLSQKVSNTLVRLNLPIPIPPDL